VVQAADEPKERLLDQILGERPVARQEVGEPEPGRSRPHVDLGQPTRTPLIGSHVGDHRRLFRTHITRTNEHPKVLRSWSGGVSVVAKVVSIEALEDTERTVLTLA
jgi:hypothetical protein